MDSKAYDFEIQAFHQEADVKLLDDIDSLRSYGISHYVALPQLVVCGDQSSGKSSVLEAISGIPFPTKDSLCTRFATEVILRRTPLEQVVVTIIPGEGREAHEGHLRNFKESLTDLSQFEGVVEVAKQFMGVSDGGTAFTDDVLRVDISGPDRPHLTIVDLPGLIHSHNKLQTPEDVQLIQALVRRYMKSSRSIVLAIVSAKNDYANQVVLKMAREVDPPGVRTLGIITKPDTLSIGSESESAYLNLARNQEVPFHLGWHVLKNRDYHSRHSTSEERDREETGFFSQGVWNQLPRSEVAVAPLRARLSRVLLNQIKSELPDLTREIEQKLRDCKAELRKMGPRRQNSDEERRFLLRLAQDFQNLAKAAVDGIYGDDFFGDPRSDTGYQKRIRAVVQNVSLEFTENMRLQGHSYEIGASEAPETSPSEKFSPERMTRDQYIEHAKSLLSRSRGRELPGTFNPLLIADLFHEQSSRWLFLAQDYLHKVCNATKIFVELVILSLMHDETADAVLQDLIDPVMDVHAARANETLQSIIATYKTGHPITYNHYFTETVQNVRVKRMEDDLTKRLRALFQSREGEVLEDMRFSKLKKTSLISALSIRNEVDMDRYACAEAVDCMMAYYKVAMKVVVDNVAVQCVEEQLIRSLPDVFSPAIVLELDATITKKLARESLASIERRQDLDRKVSVLEASLDTCRRHAKVPSKVSARQLGVNAHAKCVSEEIDCQEPEESSDDAHDLCPSLPADAWHNDALMTPNATLRVIDTSTVDRSLVNEDNKKDKKGKKKGSKTTSLAS